MRRIVIPSLLALASTAHAADYRLAYSKAENLEVFVVHAGLDCNCYGSVPVTGGGYQTYADEFICGVKK